MYKANVQSKCTKQMYKANVQSKCTKQMYKANVQSKCTKQMYKANVLMYYCVNPGNSMGSLGPCSTSEKVINLADIEGKNLYQLFVIIPRNRPRTDLEPT